MTALSALAVAASSFGVAHAGTTKFVFPQQAHLEFTLDTTGKTLSWAANELQTKTGVPAEYILFFVPKPMFDGTVFVSPLNPQDNGAALKPAASFTTETVVNVYIRPIRGDHIHTIYQFWIHDGTGHKLMRPLYDGHLEHTAPAVDGETEYYISKIHNGLHTHGKGLIHVHPWSSPKWFHATEGIGATLGAWLDDVDVTIRQPPYREALSLAFGNDVYFVTKEEYKAIITNRDNNFMTMSYNKNKFKDSRIFNGGGSSWKVLYWKHYLDLDAGLKPQIVTDQISNLWVGRNLSVVVLIYGPDTDFNTAGTKFDQVVKDKTLRDDIVEIFQAKLNEMKSLGLYFTLRQYDGDRYPSPADSENKYQLEDLKYELRDKER